MVCAKFLPPCIKLPFWSGFPITSRLEHGYWLSYYNDGEGPGMDATVYSPDEDEDPAFEVDLKFINNTPYHLADGKLLQR